MFIKCHTPISTQTRHAICVAFSYFIPTRTLLNKQYFTSGVSAQGRAVAILFGQGHVKYGGKTRYIGLHGENNGFETDFSKLHFRTYLKLTNKHLNKY